MHSQSRTPLLKAPHPCFEVYSVGVTASGAIKEKRKNG